jgi:hypothetical protein
LRSRPGCDLRPNPLDCRRQIALDQLRLEAKDAIPRPTQRSIARGICLRAPGVPSPVNLNDDACLEDQEIHDEAPDGDLTTDLESEPAIAKGFPQKPLRFCRLGPKQLRATDEQLGAAWATGMTESTPRDLLGPALCRAQPTLAHDL